MIMKCPCKDCQTRTLTCHGFCQGYKAWKTEHDRARLAAQQETGMRTNKDSQPFWRRMLKYQNNPLRRTVGNKG